MLVATPGQTTAYSTIHNNSNAGGGGNSTAAASSSSKKSTTLNSTNTTAASGTPKSLNNNNHTTSTVANKNSLNTNSHGTVSYNHHTNPKNDNSPSNKLNNQTKMTATSSRETILPSVTTAAAATTHSSKTENSTNNANANNNTTTTKQQSFIQTLKDSVQKALISTTGSSSTTLAQKFSADNKLANNCNNFTTSIQNVTSSSSSTSHNANKVSTTTSSTNSSNSTVATQSSSSSSLVRSKYFSCSLSKLHTVAPTILHRYPEERQHASSTDSLQKEMCHFKPIRIVPTTPCKSGSKSRGNSLRFPKANLATKKMESVLKSNCDLNNRKKKQQQNRTQNDKINVDEDNDDDDDNNEQENKEFYGIYKPKPSLTCLSTSVTTPNHQSAFVCLVAQMKSLVNLQSKTQHRPAKSAVAADETINELYVRKKPATKKTSQLEVPKELVKTRTTRLSSNAVKNKRVSNTNTIALNHSKENVKRTNAKSNNLSKLSTVAITKAKSLRKVGRAKSKTINLINLATTRAKGKLQTSVSMPAVISNKSKTIAAATSKRTRKRKNPHDNDETDPPNKTASIKSLVPAARKSSRQSKDTNKLFKSPINQYPPKTTLKSTQKSTRKNPAKAACFSPPLTRSRLKHLAEQGKIITANTNKISKQIF